MSEWGQERQADRQREKREKRGKRGERDKRKEEAGEERDQSYIHFIEEETRHE